MIGIGFCLDGIYISETDFTILAVCDILTIGMNFCDIDYLLYKFQREKR